MCDAVWCVPCQCAAGWTGADCSLRTCPTAVAWFGYPTAPNQVPLPPSLLPDRAPHLVRAAQASATRPSAVLARFDHAHIHLTHLAPQPCVFYQLYERDHLLTMPMSSCPCPCPCPCHRAGAPLGGGGVRRHGQLRPRLGRVLLHARLHRRGVPGTAGDSLGHCCGFHTH